MLSNLKMIKATHAWSINMLIPSKRRSRNKRAASIKIVCSNVFLVGAKPFVSCISFAVTVWAFKRNQSQPCGVLVWAVNTAIKLYKFDLMGHSPMQRAPFVPVVRLTVLRMPLGGASTLTHMLGFAHAMATVSMLWRPASNLSSTAQCLKMQKATNVLHASLDGSSPYQLFNSVGLT
jgi:hypothetical protein